MAKSKKHIIVRGKGEDQTRIATSWFLEKKEDEAVRLMKHVDSGRIRSMWKEAHGVSVPNHSKNETKASEKPKKD